MDGYSIRQFAEVPREPKETDGMNALATFGGIWNSVQAWLLPPLEDEIGELDDKHRQFVAVCEICALQEHMADYRWVGNNFVRVIRTGRTPWPQSQGGRSVSIFGVFRGRERR